MGRRTFLACHPCIFGTTASAGWRVIGRPGQMLFVLFISAMVIGCSIPSSSTAPAIQSPVPLATPSQAPYPVEPPIFPPFPAQQPTRRPPITRIIPTPPTPLSRTARFTRDQAIATAMSNNPSFASLQASGQLTATAALVTTWADYQAAGPASVHPDLPVWVVRLEVPPWTELRGPVGQQIRVTWYGWGYVIDGLTGNMIVGFRIPEGGH